MFWWSLLKWFVIIFGVTMGLSYSIVTFGPIVGLCFGLIYAACKSGSTWYLFVSIWLLPALIAIITSPMMVDYMNLRRERKDRLEKEADLE